MSELEIAPWRDTLWKQFRDVKPEFICPKAIAHYNDKGFYSVKFFNNDYNVYPVEEKIEGPQGDTIAPYPKFELVLLSYLIHAKDVPSTGKWISEKDLPGGSTFFQGPHKLPDAPLIKHFGNDASGFVEISKKLGGNKLEYGDASFAFQVLPRISLGSVLWLEDDEFPAGANYLFDSSIEHHLALDVVYALIKCFLRKLLESC